MIIYPAIDLKGGKCVRLMRGKLNEATIYNDDPVDQANKFARAGFSWLHIVDLDGAEQGMPANAAAVRKILKAERLPIQLGGGIRNMSQIKAWLNAGVDRVILGTAAVQNPDLVRQACAAFPGRIVLGLDAKGAQVAIKGWVEVTDLSVTDLAKKFEDAGAAAIIYTDIERDGTRDGVNIESTRALAKNLKIPVIASGGVGTLADIEAVRDAKADNVQGVIVGRAFYDGSIDPAAALAISGAADA